jgi:hypothetical protein
MTISANINIPTPYPPQSFARLDQTENALYKPAALAQDANSKSTSSVIISTEAQGLYRQEQSAEKPPPSKAELQAIFQRTNGPTSNSVRLSTQMNSQGKTSELLMQKPLDTSPERLAKAEKIASFVFIQHTTLNRTGNPYDGLSRDELSNIYYDETGNHTPAERYLAGFTRQVKDFEFLTRNTGNSGTSYRAQIAFYDARSPVERSMYSEGYREQLVSFLEQAEANGYPNTEETIWDPWMTKYLHKPNANSPVTEQTLIQPLAAKTTESALSCVEKPA